MAEPALNSKVVKALFNFKATNNDELTFSKGDIVTVTQVVDGGWWEGTLGDKTGWFPSNFVKEMKPDPHGGMVSPPPAAIDPATAKRESMLFYHNVVLQSLIDSERLLVTELKTLLQNFIHPLEAAGILSTAEYVALAGNLGEITAMHEDLLTKLDDVAKLPLQQQRVGGAFMQEAPKLKAMYHAYCANHPRAAMVLQNKRDALNTFMESQGAKGIMVLTTSLSKPFTRLDKYPNLLKELERHTDESHVDRGDTQRAISVYRDISSSCCDVRRQKEMEFEIMNSTIQGWEGECISDLGEVLLMSHVKMEMEDGERKEPFLLLFPGLLVMLSITPRLSGYVFEGKFPVSGISVESIEDSEEKSNAFELSGTLLDHRIVTCTSAIEKQQWIDTLRTQAKTGSTCPATKPQSLKIPNHQPTLNALGQAKTTLPISQEPPPKPPHAVWLFSCLRPTPPVRPTFFQKEENLKSPKVNRKGSFRTKKLVDDTKTLEDDALLLKVVEAYCTSAKARQTVNSSIFDNSPHVIIAEDEKIIVETVRGSETVIEEKSLVDTVYSLKDQIKDLKSEMGKLKKLFEEEKRARMRLENRLRKPITKILEHKIYNEASHA